MLLPIHIIAGGTAIICGAIALMVKKGSTMHRRVGVAFVYAMATMGISASILAVVRNAGAINITAAFLTLYFISTAWLTVRTPSLWTRRFNIIAMTAALGVSVLYIVGGVRAFNMPRGFLNGVPFQMYFFLALVLLLAAMGDGRMIRASVLTGAPRLRRHLWRMCFALFIAAGSFFSIRERVAAVFPEPFTSGPTRAMPIVLIFGSMFYWLWRVRRRLPPPTLSERHPA
jgi:uncharacterized membrane protein